MTSHSKIEWAERLIPNLDQAATADVISRLCDFAFVISRDGEIIQTMSSPFLTPRLDLAPWHGQQFRDTLTIESVPKFEARLAEFKEGQQEMRPVEFIRLGQVSNSTACLFPRQQTTVPKNYLK